MSVSQGAGTVEALTSGKGAARSVLEKASRAQSYGGFIRSLPAFEGGAHLAGGAAEKAGVENPWSLLGIHIAGGLAATSVYEKGIHMASASVPAVAEYSNAAGWVYLLGKVVMWEHEMLEEKKMNGTIHDQKQRIDVFALEALNYQLGGEESPVQYDYESLRTLLAEWGVDSRNEEFHRTEEQETGHQMLFDLALAIDDYLKYHEELSRDDFETWREQEWQGSIYEKVRSYQDTRTEVAMAVMIEFTLGKEALHKSHRFMIESGDQKEMADEFRALLQGEKEPSDLVASAE